MLNASSNGDRIGLSFFVKSLLIFVIAIVPSSSLQALAQTKTAPASSIQSIILGDKLDRQTDTGIYFCA